MVFSPKQVFGLNSTSGQLVWMQYPAATTEFMPHDVAVYNENVLFLRTAQAEIVGINVFTGTTVLTMNTHGSAMGIRIWNDVLLYVTGWEGGSNQVYAATIPAYVATQTPGGGPQVKAAPTLPPRVTFPMVTAAPTNAATSTAVPVTATQGPSSIGTTFAPVLSVTLQAQISDPSSFNAQLLEDALEAQTGASSGEISVVKSADGNSVTITFTGARCAEQAATATTWSETAGSSMGMGPLSPAPPQPAPSPKSSNIGVVVAVVLVLLVLGVGGVIGFIQLRKRNRRNGAEGFHESYKAQLQTAEAEEMMNNLVATRQDV